MKLVSIAVLAALALTASLAHAGGKVKAHIECSLDGGLKIKKGQKVPLDKDVFCIVVLDGKGAPPPADETTASVWLVEQRSDGPFNTQGAQAALVGEEDMNYYQPEAPFHHGTDFQPCTGFTVHANITDNQGENWAGTFAIAAKCPAPKKLNAKLDCMMDMGDAAMKWPGNGDKVKPRMEGELDCVVQSKTQPTEGTKATFTVSHADGTKVVHTTEFREYPSDPVSYGSDQAFTEDEYAACSNFTLTVTAIDATGQTVWTGNHKFKQDCPD